MAVDDDGSKWLPPGKVREYCVEHTSATVEEAAEKLWKAVITGKVRARHKGRVFGPEWIKQLALLNPSPGHPFALPPDIELSFDDAQQIWGFLYSAPRDLE